MRRGHPNSGWRNNNPRHFGPRTGGNPHYRPRYRPPFLEPTRYPTAGPRPPRLTQNFDEPPGESRFMRHVFEQRNIHKSSNQTRTYDSQQNYQNAKSPYKQFPQKFYENQTGTCRMNSMGDIDHRQIRDIDERYFQGNLNQRSYVRENLKLGHEDNEEGDEFLFQRRHRPWQKPPPCIDRMQNYEERYDLNSAATRVPVVPLEYSGHRPPSSNYYDNRPEATNDGSHSFNRSEDDTVDIVRKRLQSRNEGHQEIHPHQPVVEHKSDNVDTGVPNTGVSDDCQVGSSSNITKKRVQRQKPTVKSNCDKIKTNIVHQLFKMDKEKIHKLMDNPSSSTKFEYAISTLITESQNSLNRHMRTMAEKSLCTSSEFIQHEDNTIYEDTFMKQMTCVLDPQDTIFLQDIKPLVMAEICKVLQLDENDQNPGFANQYNFPDQNTVDSSLIDIQEHGNDYHQGSYFDVYSQDSDECIEYEYLEQSYDQKTGRKHHVDNEISTIADKKKDEKRESHDKTSIGKNWKEIMDKRNEERKSREEKRPATPLPVFQSIDNFSDDEDPFAELDKQYHVPVDRNYIEKDDITSQDKSSESIVTSTTNLSKTVKDTLHNTSIKKETTEQIQHFSKSPAKYHSAQVTSFLTSSEEKPVKSTSDTKAIKCLDFKDAKRSIKKEVEVADTEKSEHNVLYKKVDSNPSHRKEKRKKSDASSNDKNSQTLNKNIVINVNDCASKTDKEDSSKSVFNMYFSKDSNENTPTKISEKSKTSDKSYSDKYVKRKEGTKRHSSTEEKKKNSSVSSSHSNTSPKESLTSKVKQNTSKHEPKSKLQPIDIFIERSKRGGLPSQSDKSVSVLPLTPSKNITNKTFVCSKTKLFKKHVGIQVVKKQSKSDKEVQIKIPSANKSVQTDPVLIKASSKMTGSLERMREIDLEIQMLLQERFQFYNSAEGKGLLTSNTIPDLGMAVFNVPQGELTNDTTVEDTIVENFTNIPVEELEEIALETSTIKEINVLDEHSTKKSNKNKRQKRKASKLQEEKQISPARPATKRPKRSVKDPNIDPNISLIEEIISDDRPLEDIISLEQFEEDDNKPLMKSTKSKPSTKKKSVKKTVKRVKPLKIVKLKTEEEYHVVPSDKKIKPCSVRLERIDIHSYFNKFSESQDEVNHNIKYEENIAEVGREEIIEEPIINDAQFMFDVSEDIVIGDISEEKSPEDKVVVENALIATTDEIILDNSQQSVSDEKQPETSCNENQCKMYDYAADENMKRDSLKVTGHGDAVLAIECTNDNNFVAACLDGNVYYFNNEGVLLSTIRASTLAVTCMTVVKDKTGTTLITGSLDSRLRHYYLETGMEKGPECNVLSPIQSMDRAWGSVFVGTRTGFCMQFECKNDLLIPVSSIKFSDNAILTLKAMKEGPRKVLLVAARSENVTIKDAQTGLLLRTLEGPQMTVYSLLYEDGKVFCGTSGHQIQVFDYASGCHVGTHSGGKGAVCLRAAGGLVFAGCYDGCVYVYREGESRPAAQLRGPSLMLLSLAVLGTKIIAGFKDRSLYIWKIPLNILKEMVL